MIKNKLNLVFVVVDSVRSYSGAGDDRDKIQFMDMFGKESIEFTNAITSAPSTYMAIGSMLTSLPSYYLCRNYDDFLFDPVLYDSNSFHTLNTILKKNAYNCYAFFLSRLAREGFTSLFEEVPPKFWGKGIRHKDNWTHEQLNQVLENVLKSNPKKPAYIYLHYNCRLNDQTSEHVEKGFKLLKQNGFTDENTVFVLCSDHGYPDPRRNLKKYMMEHKTHDVILTDDNIKIPLYIKYPGCTPKKIPELVCTEDVLPTLLALLNIHVEKKITQLFNGINLVPFIETNNIEYYNKDRKVRTDIKFMAQKGRATSLRGQNYKYIIHHDTKDEEFYDLTIDKDETKNVIHNQKLADTIQTFRDAFNTDEEKACRFHFNFLLKRLSKTLFLSDIPSPKIMIIGACEKSYINLLAKGLKELYPSSKVDVLCTEKNKEDIVKSLCNNLFCDMLGITHKELKKIIQQKFNQKYDVVLIPIDYKLKKEQAGALRVSKLVERKKMMIVDYNLMSHKSLVDRYLKKLYYKRKYYYDDPTLILEEIKRIWNFISTQLKIKCGLTK